MDPSGWISRKKPKTAPVITPAVTNAHKLAIVAQCVRGWIWEENVECNWRIALLRREYATLELKNAEQERTLTLRRDRINVLENANRFQQETIEDQAAEIENLHAYSHQLEQLVAVLRARLASVQSVVLESNSELEDSQETLLESDVEI